MALCTRGGLYKSVKGCFPLSNPAKSSDYYPPMPGLSKTCQNAGTDARTAMQGRR